MRPVVIPIVIVGILAVATAAAVVRRPPDDTKTKSRSAARSHATKRPQASPTEVIVPLEDGDGSGGSAPAGPVIITQTVDYSIPAWGVSASETFRMTTTSAGLQGVDILDASGNVTKTITRQDYEAAIQSISSVAFSAPGAACSAIPELDLTMGFGSTLTPVDRSFVTGIPGPADSTFTLVGRIHN